MDKYARVPGSTSEVAKQGAYGKVKTHSEPLLEQLSHVDEVLTAVAYKLGLSGTKQPEPLGHDAPPHYRFCEDMLKKTSRSFCLVIQQLPWPLRKAVCVFYLVLRGLDTVEDDMVSFKDRPADKLRHLRAFKEYILNDSWSMDNVGEGDERTLLQAFFNVSRSLLELPPSDRDIVVDICRLMGEGMASYCGRDLREGTEDASDYNEYCFIVAGLVGEGLTRLWVAHGEESADLSGREMPLAHQMGLFLQKTNIIRDYLEDLVEGRAFWPKSVWKLYAPSGQLGELRALVDSGSASGGDRALACLNHLVADALTLAPACLSYLAALKNRGDVFRFCAIPQVMAIATLAKVVNNRDVFTGVVKIRKGKALVLLTGANDMQSVYRTFRSYTRAIAAAIPPRHGAAHAIAAAAASRIERACEDGRSLDAASPAVIAQNRNFWLRVAAFSCPLVGFVAHAAWQKAKPHLGSFGIQGFVSAFLLIVLIAALYSFLAATRPSAKVRPAYAAQEAVPNSPGVELGF